MATKMMNMSPQSDDNTGIRSAIDSDCDDMFVSAPISCNTSVTEFRRVNNGDSKDKNENASSQDDRIGSVMIVFNTWNAMIGCGTVTIPWAFQQSGIMLGVVLTAVACIFAFVTNYLLLRVAGKDTNFSDTMHRYFPSCGWAVSMGCFIVNFYVGIILFFQVLSQSLYPIILFAMGSEAPIETKTDWSQFSLSYSCLILLVIVLIMTAPRDTAYVQKINAFGVVFVMIFLLFIMYNGFKSMTSTNYVYSEFDYNTAVANPDQAYTAWIPLSGSQFTPLMGILGGGFYFHNMSLSLASNARYPEHNTRNIFIGFLLVFLTYSIIGITGVYGFTGSAFASFNPSVNLIKENCLNMMASDDKLATFIRACILCQLLTVNTLLFGLLRSQIILFYNGVTKGIESVTQGQDEIRLSRCKNFMLSFTMTLPPLALAIWYPYVGKLGALIAAFSTMFVIYILPLATFTKAVKLQQDKQKSEDCSEMELLLNSEQKAFNIQKNSQSFFEKELDGLNFKRLDFESNEKDQDQEVQTKNQKKFKQQEEEQLTSFSLREVIIGSTMLAAYGITVFVIQLFYLA